MTTQSLFEEYKQIKKMCDYDDFRIIDEYARRICEEKSLIEFYEDIIENHKMLYKIFKEDYDKERASTCPPPPMM